MTDFEKDNDDIWVFLSHSNKDFDKVRILRNKMEDRGMRPLMFFLKCLDDDPEIFELLKREIDVRPRFFLCESDNSKSSKWVQREVQYIKSKDRAYITVDMDDVDSFEAKIQEMKSRSQVFISYSRNDISIANAIGTALRHKGFQVFDFIKDFIPLGVPMAKYLKDKITEISNRGYFLPIITENSANSQFMQRELLLASKNDAYILPVIHNAEHIDPTTKYLISNVPYRYELDPEVSAKSIKGLCEKLIEIDLKRNK